MSALVAPAADAKFLLSLQVLLDLCGTAANPARVWAQSVRTVRLRLSVVTVALAHAAVAGATDPQARARLSARLTDLLAKLAADGGRPLPFAEGAATAWQSFMREPTLGDLSQIDRQFYSTAFSEGLCVIEYEHPHSAALGPLGIKVQSLGPRS